MQHEERVRRLTPPAGAGVDVILDTDTYNEVDDQYALAYLLLSQEGYNVRAITAAPFSNKRAATPGEGMELSYREIGRILSLTGKADYADRVFPGSTSYLPDEATPVPSRACDQIVALARRASPERPLYVLAIGAITNVASALLCDPSIAQRIVVVWLGGHALDWPDTREFNMHQDIAAVRAVYASGAPLVQLPCCGVASHLTTTGPELEHWLRGKNELCDYLTDITCREGNRNGPCWSRVIWDVSAVAWLKGGMLRQRLQRLPLCGYDGIYTPERTSDVCGYVYAVDRDRIFRDLFATLGGAL